VVWARGNELQVANRKGKNAGFVSDRPRQFTGCRGTPVSDNTCPLDGIGVQNVVSAYGADDSRHVHPQGGWDGRSVSTVVGFGEW